MLSLVMANISIIRSLFYFFLFLGWMGDGRWGVYTHSFLGSFVVWSNLFFQSGKRDWTWIRQLYIKVKFILALLITLDWYQYLFDICLIWQHVITNELLYIFKMIMFQRLLINVLLYYASYIDNKHLYALVCNVW